jgi:hypothetical protein
MACPSSTTGPTRKVRASPSTSDVFAPTILRKLVREIAGSGLGGRRQFAEGASLGRRN